MRLSDLNWSPCRKGWASMLAMPLQQQDTGMVHLFRMRRREQADVTYRAPLAGRCSSASHPSPCACPLSVCQWPIGHSPIACSTDAEECIQRIYQEARHAVHSNRLGS